MEQDVENVKSPYEKALEFIVSLFEVKGVIHSNSTIRFLLEDMLGLTFDSAQIRAMIHEIRTKDLVKNLIANGTGYFVAIDFHQSQLYIDRLQKRAMQIHEVQAAIRRQMQDTLIDQQKLPLENVL